jgi:hypothetical protein
MPFLVLLIKYLKKYFTFEVQVIDDKNVKRRFRASNYQSNTRVKPFICTIPMKLDEGWNQIHFNLTDFTRRAYGTNYLETLRVQIHANCRIRRIYFTDQLLSSKSIPAEYRAFSNAQEDNAEDQYQNQLNNDPNQMQGEGEEQYQAEYEHQQQMEEHQHIEGGEHEQEQEHQEGEEEQGGEEQQQQPPAGEEQKQEEGNAGEEEQPKEQNPVNQEGAAQEQPAQQ